MSSPPYIHWIHCNICYKQYIKKEQLFYLLACHHVICNLCLSEVPQMINGPRVYRCGMCQKITKACEINNTMPKNLKELFHPEPYIDGLNHFQIMMFQTDHRRRFLEHQDMKISKIKEYRREFLRLKDQAQKTYHEYDELNSERKHLEKRVRLIREQRREIDDNRSVKSKSSSSGQSSCSEKRESPTNSDSGITSFSNLAHSHSFVL